MSKNFMIFQNSFSDHRIVSIVAYDNKTHGIGCYPEKNCH